MPHKVEGVRNQVRIIGGQWRSRRLTFPAVAMLRPTPDRIRETLFNWLAPKIAGSTCLDLFAGSGALGFEALSRGAKTCVFVDSSPQVADALRDNRETLQAASAEVICAALPHWLTQTPTQQFDIIFLDPPFQKNSLASCCEKLSPWLKKKALIYMEAESHLTAWPSEPGWTLLREKQSGEVKYGLWRVEKNS